MVNLNILISEEQHKNLKKLSALKKKSLGAIVREILDDALGTVDAATIVFKHPDGKEEQL